MTKKQQFAWWAYIVGGLILILFIVPTLISASDTLAVIAAIVLLVLFGVVSWHFWVRRAYQSIKENL